MYKKIDSSRKFIDIEKDILELWKEKDIINKSFNSNQDAEYYTFYDGPPTANGKPHIGHVVTRVVKDLIPRYKVMKGYKVLRKAGWDTHGLPVELEVEKSLNISGKDQIEAYGVEEFVKKCKESVFTYANQWKSMSERIGYWVDMDDPYVTFHNNYIESVWWSIKEFYNKNLIYEGHKVVPYCPRCGTSLSSHEVSQGYKEVKDTSVFVKFKIKNENNKYLLAWTTTPWTLPSNIALAINRSYVYVEIDIDGEILILAKDLLSKIDEEYSIIKEFKGSELEGVCYDPVYNFATVDKKAFYVVHADYVTSQDGSGIVHTAPAFGEDDNLIAKKYDLPMINLVDTEGKFVKEVTNWAGELVKKTDEKIVKDLSDRNLLYKSEKFLHSYPFCWRCDTALIYYPRKSWFFKMSQNRDKLVENNETINWLPNNVKNGRFGNFIENVIDWGFSRERYWGTPIPIWKCECGNIHCIGSIEELKTLGKNVPDNIELHKPYVDSITIACSKCGKDMNRVSEVMDCWYDSGAMPFAQHHYPFENKEIFEANFPAQFISEAVDQTRGWFYTLHAISTSIFDKAAFENVIVLGHVLDKNGIKMSKHKGNVLDPWTVLDAEGADATRWHFYTSGAPWLPSRFSIESVKEAQRRLITTFWNVYSFYVLYANIDDYNANEHKNVETDNIMDKWIISKLNTLIKNVTKNLDEYNITLAASLIEDFVDELSNWYVRRNRARFWADGLENDKISAYNTLYEVLVSLTKILAPFVPFTTEEIYQNLVVSVDKDSKESVHLCAYPLADESKIDINLEKEMDLAYSLVKLGRSARNAENIKNRQPLNKILINTAVLPEYYGEIIKEELNIKFVELGADFSKFVNFEIKINLPVFGKKYGKLIPKVKKMISMEDQMELATKINKGETIHFDIDGEDVELSKENLLVTMQGLEGYAFAGARELGVILDTNITEELIEEGFVREFISKVQNMRKESGFEVSDKIDIFIEVPEKLENIFKKNEDYIKKETLCINMNYNKENDKYVNQVLNGEEILLALLKK